MLLWEMDMRRFLTALGIALAFSVAFPVISFAECPKGSNPGRYENSLPKGKAPARSGEGKSGMPDKGGFKRK